MVRKLLLIALLIVLMSACGPAQTPPPNASEIFKLIAVIDDSSGCTGGTRIYEGSENLKYTTYVAINCRGVSISR